VRRDGGEGIVRRFAPKGENGGPVLCRHSGEKPESMNTARREWTPAFAGVTAEDFHPAGSARQAGVELAMTVVFSLQRL
jgi:hypothetical protein